MVAEIRANERPSMARCAFCHEVLGVRELACGLCGSLLHDECATQLRRRCPSLGCQGTLGVGPSAGLAPAPTRTRRRPVLGALVIAAGLAFFVTACLLVASHRQAVIEKLSASGIQVDALVTKHTPGNHDQMYFSYVVKGETYEGHDYASGRRPGAHVTVTCLPDDPGTYVLGTNPWDYSGGAGGILVMPVFMISMAVGANLILGQRDAKRQV